jgi:hypothetical protein
MIARICDICGKRTGQIMCRRVALLKLGLFKTGFAHQQCFLKAATEKERPHQVEKCSEKG